VTTPFMSVIVPVYQGARVLPRCLSALRASEMPRGSWELIIVDDASTDATALIAAEFADAVVRLPDRPRGPAYARNRGVELARGEIVVFVDADVCVHTDTLRKFTSVLAHEPDVSAVFGAYDTQPEAPQLVSQYRNLLHHFTHQHGHPEASTFWAGCGAVRRSVFNDVGGFDEKRFPRPSIEDIELGYRLRRAHHRIVLDKGLQGTHLKAWRFPSVVWIDVTRRAIPWARLMLESGRMPDDLNLKLGQRVSGGLVGAAFMLLLLGVVWPRLTAVAALAILAVIGLNRHLFAFFARERGLFFAAACVPLHLLYYLYSGLSYVTVWAAWQIGAIRRPGNRRPERVEMR